MAWLDKGTWPRLVDLHMEKCWESPRKIQIFCQEWVGVFFVIFVCWLNFLDTITCTIFIALVNSLEIDARWLSKEDLQFRVQTTLPKVVCQGRRLIWGAGSNMTCAWQSFLNVVPATWELKFLSAGIPGWSLKKPCKRWSNLYFLALDIRIDWLNPHFPSWFPSLISQISSFWYQFAWQLLSWLPIRVRNGVHCMPHDLLIMSSSCSVNSEGERH